VLVDELDVVMVLSPVITHEQHRTDLLNLADIRSAAWRRTPSDLMAKVL